MAERQPRYVLAELMLIVALCGLVFGFVRWLATGRASLLIFLLFEFAFLGWYAGWRTVRGKRKARPCEECERSFVPVKAADGNLLCPRCRQRALSPAQLKRQQRQGLGMLILILTVGTLFFGLILSSFVNAHFRRHYWIALPLLSLGASIGLIAVLVFARVGLIVVRYRSMKRESYALAAARA